MLIRSVSVEDCFVYALTRSFSYTKIGGKDWGTVCVPFLLILEVSWNVHPN